jgi:hypothetical protein
MQRLVLRTFVVAGSCHVWVGTAEAAITVFELLMMSGVSLETRWAIKKHLNNKFYYTVASGWLFLYDLYYDARIHEHQLNLFRTLESYCHYLYTPLFSQNSHTKTIFKSQYSETRATPPDATYNTTSTYLVWAPLPSLLQAFTKQPSLSCQS